VVNHDRKWISIADAAQHLSVSPRTIRRLIASGDLPGYRIGGHCGRLGHVELTDVDAFLTATPAR
jgi:excisionase family DNA binding protein